MLKFLKHKNVFRNLMTNLKPIQDINKEIQSVKSVSIKCISEIGWDSNETILADVISAGGMKASQYKVDFNQNNSKGSCSLITLKYNNQDDVNVLLDTGWNQEYMKERFKVTGVDQLLRQEKISCVVISHEHMDHFWGFPTLVELQPKIPLIIPSTFTEQGMNMIRSTNYQGQIFKTQLDRFYKVSQGCLLYCFDCDPGLGIQGEQSLYFNVEGKGIVIATGCCHQGVHALLQNALDKIDQKLYGLYGGLHIAPFAEIDDVGIESVQQLKQFDLEKVACNHCTGLSAVKQMIKEGIPVVEGSGQQGSKSNLYIGNSDQIQF